MSNLPLQSPLPDQQAGSHRPVVALSGVTKVFGESSIAVTALNNVSISFREREFTAIMGPSGSGKSTMLHLLAGLDSASSGSVTVEGTDLTTLGDDELTKLRRDRIGFVFQSFNLVPTLDAKANIELPLRLAGKSADDQWKQQIITALGLQERLTHKPSQLSGGQQQRVAIARALLMQPAVIVADEPTGNLDSAASHEVLSLLRQAVEQFGQTVIMVTHDYRAAAMADRVVVVQDGRIVADLEHPTTEAIAQVA
ncbi:ABC transporter ATP-binding protein [Changpingibacter yushuensis]|uniref:ABC transporter ATP-binding protein n=1 Tax=Changpingibacter yushuensis TaxID=2758440 RepID=UPI0015F59470|nr:ABC transporter ATP-binding protein [Changpingibacter yushuensis]